MRFNAFRLPDTGFNRWRKKETIILLITWVIVPRPMHIATSQQPK